MTDTERITRLADLVREIVGDLCNAGILSEHDHFYFLNQLSELEVEK